MRRFISSLAALAALCLPPAAAQDTDVKIPVIEDVAFYDGYDSNIQVYGDEGLLVHSNSLVAKRLTDDQLDLIGERLGINVNIHALCDDFDRLGSVRIALVPKGSDKYEEADVQRFEVARFVTPFMNRNKSPKTVPYEYRVDALGLLLRDSELRAAYDFWLELDLFGIPYDAREKVRGCEERSDVFAAEVSLATSPQPAGVSSGNCLVPIYVKASEDRGPVNLNNYKEAATDTIGKTTRTWTFDVPADLADARLMFINTNHGAGENGEEYVRRKHIIYFDGEKAMSYFPGGVSCEPYRVYNTMGNGIYTREERMDWMFWNNWCPGQAVPTREIELGAVSKGRHSVMVRVPKAEFYGQDGDFRPSMYLQGVTAGTLPAGVATAGDDIEGLTVTREGTRLTLTSPVALAEVALYGLDGTLLYGRHTDSTAVAVPLPDAGRVPYIISVVMADGRRAWRKVL